MKTRLAPVSLLALVVALGIAAGANAEQSRSLAEGPTISGAAQVGATLSSDIGPLRCQPQCTHTLEWLSCVGPSKGGVYHPAGEPVDPNERAPNCEIRWASPAPERYTVDPDDEGRHIQFHVFVETVTCDEEDVCTAFHEEAYSPTIGPIAPVPVPPAIAPANTVPPALSGVAEEGQVMNVSPGTWTGAAPITLSYQWERCTGGLDTCRAVAGETDKDYTVRAADIGARIAATVTATNRAGKRSVTAGPSAQVVPARPRPGRDTRKIEELLPADRLRVKSVEGSRVARSRSGVLLRVTVVDRRGFLIDGATVTAAGRPGAVVPVKRKTGTRGVAFVPVRLGPRAVAPSRLQVTITASKPGVATLRARARIVLRVVAL